MQLKWCPNPGFLRLYSQIGIKKGILLAHELESQLRSLEVSFNSELRRKFSSVSRKDIKDVESLASLYARLYDIAKGNPSGF